MNSQALDAPKKDYEKSTPTRRGVVKASVMRRIAIAIVVVIVVFGIAIALQNGSRPAPAAQLVTVSGSDGQGGIIDPINVSETYVPRGRTVAQVHPGDRVTMLRREGQGVLIQTSAGVQGWVTYWFIEGQKP